MNHDFLMFAAGMLVSLLVVYGVSKPRQPEPPSSNGNPKVCRHCGCADPL